MGKAIQLQLFFVVMFWIQNQNKIDLKAKIKIHGLNQTNKQFAVYGD